MIQAANPISEQLQAWVNRVQALMEQITQWSEAEGWTVEREDRTIEEDRIGTYRVPALRIFLTKGELLLEPKALDTRGKEGRVDLSAYPAMTSVMLLGTAGSWEVMTESNIPLRQPWNRETFVQMVQDMILL